MTEVIASGPVLADSTFRSRPNFQSYLLSDANAGGNTVQQIEHRRRVRHMKFPRLTGKGDVDSFQTSTTEPPFKKWNDEGDHRAEAPYRDYDNIVDPVSGFVSAGGDVDRNTNHSKIKSLVQLSDTPQAVPPQSKHSDRKTKDKAPPELRRSNTYEPGAPSLWNSRGTSDIWIRSQLGGWTSDYDPRQPAPETDKRRAKSAFIPKPPSQQSRPGRDHLAMKYMFSSSTQKSYEEVPWDIMLPPKQWAPVSTLEDKPDMISQTSTLKRYDPAAQEWQGTGRSWDWFQTRPGYYKKQPIVFCSPCPRTKHIPIYSGSIGAENLDEIDNAQEPFEPYTIKRVLIPRYSETGHRPNIPGYQGCTLWQGQYAPAHTTPMTPNKQATTAIVHKSLPVSPNTSEFKKDSQMSKMVTTVPPCNPFNQINKLDEILANQVGSIGAENLDEIDNAQEPFEPYTIKRVLIPRYSETGHRPNIPGYQGCTLWQGQYAPAHTTPMTPNKQATTAIVHKSLPVSPNTSEFKKDSQMSKMVTTVPPCNPFNQINKLDEILANQV